MRLDARFRADFGEQDLAIGQGEHRQATEETGADDFALGFNGRDVIGDGRLTHDFLPATGLPAPQRARERARAFETMLSAVWQGRADLNIRWSRAGSQSPSRNARLSTGYVPSKRTIVALAELCGRGQAKDRHFRPLA
jgi:hypothetical protein